MMGEILQVLEEEAHKISMLSPEGIRIAKGEVVNITKRNMPFIEPAP